MDNLRNFFGRFWKEGRSEPKHESQTRSKLTAGDNFQNDIHPKLYSPWYREQDQDKGLEDYPNTQNNSRHEFDPSQYNERPSLIFGNLFSVIGEMFIDMERSMHEMNQFFEEGSEHFNRPGFGMLDAIPPQYNPNTLEGFENDEEKSSNGNPDKNTNLRDQILKKDLPQNRKEKTDTILDDLYKENKLDFNDLFSEEKKSQSTKIVPVPAPKTNQSMRTRTSSQSSYSFTNGKWQVKEKLVKETSEGKEVTTRTTNEKGEVESTTEFFPYSNSGNSVKSFDDGSDDMLKMASIFERFFKPRM